MPRPYLPNSNPTAKRGKEREDSHVRQETVAERKVRKRTEAEARNANTKPENRKAFRKATQRAA